MRRRWWTDSSLGASGDRDGKGDGVNHGIGRMTSRSISATTTRAPLRLPPQLRPFKAGSTDQRYPNATTAPTPLDTTSSTRPAPRC